MIVVFLFQEKKLERHCRSASTCNALYVTLLARMITRLANTVFAVQKCWSSQTNSLFVTFQHWFNSLTYWNVITGLSAVLIVHFKQQQYLKIWLFVYFTAFLGKRQGTYYFHYNVMYYGKVFCDHVFEIFVELRFVLLLPSSSSCWSLEKSLEQCLQCQDTMSLYRLALKMTLNSLNNDRERHIMREVTYTEKKITVSSLHSNRGGPG